MLCTKLNIIYGSDIIKLQDNLLVMAQLFILHSCLFYRIHIKLDGQEVREFTIENPSKDIELFYLGYKKRVNVKNGRVG